MRFCLEAGGLEVGDLDAVAYSYDPVLAAGRGHSGGLGPQEDGHPAADEWEWLRTLFVQRAPLFLRTALPGRVVTVASTLGLRALGDATAYCASKFGVIGFTRALAVEAQGRFGVTLLVPGGMQTAFFDDRPEQYRPGPDASLAPPVEVARAVLFALTRPNGLEVRELTVTVSTEPSWP